MTVQLDNPAGRLHSVLVKFASQPGPISIDQAWARTLDCGESDRAALGEALAEVSTLLSAVSVASASLDSSSGSAAIHQFPQWATAIYGFGHSRTSGVHPSQVISPDALAALASFSTILHFHIPEWSFGSNFDIEILEGARQQLIDLVDELSADEVLPEPVRTRLIAKLVEAINSIRFVELRGAERVRDDLIIAWQSGELSPESRSACSQGVLERLDDYSKKTLSIAERIWGMMAPPAGAIYLMSTGDFMGGSAIMSVNPRAAKALERVVGAISRGRTAIEDTTER